MRETVENPVNGTFEYRQSRLNISTAKLELSLEKNEVREGSFSVAARENLPVRGYVYSSSLRMTCRVSEFEALFQEVGYVFDSAGMDEGEVHNGEIHIVAQGGEYRIPFTVSIAYPLALSSVGPVRNLFHFTNLAKSCWEEAVELFYSERFGEIFTGNDRQYLEYYLGLSAGTQREQCVEEFLISIRKKEAVRFQAETGEMTLSDTGDMGEQDIILTKSGWGYAGLKVEAFGDFLIPGRDRLTADDFDGNIMHFGYRIDEEKLHGGNNTGLLRFYNIYQEFTVRVTVRRGGVPEARRQKRKALGEIWVKLLRLYTDFRIRRIQLSVWIRESVQLLEDWEDIEPGGPFLWLLRAQLLAAGQKYNEAAWNLEQAAAEGAADAGKPQLYAYYLYLTTLCRREEDYIDRVTGTVRNIYRECPRFPVLFSLLYLDEELSFNLTRKFSLLEEQFESGCRSVLLYAETYALIAQEPALLSELSGFALQVLTWAARNGRVDRAVVSQVLSLCREMKRDSSLLLKLLEEYYEEYRDEEIVHAVCSLLIRWGRSGGEYFPWFELGVEYGLRITKLYEYYMLSVPMDREEVLPRTVLMYFAYASDLDYERNALLYVNVLKNREVYPHIAESYNRHIQEFVREQIGKGRISRDLAYLYEETLKPESLPAETAQKLAGLIQSCEVAVTKPGITRVAVVHSRLRGEETFPVSGGRAYVRIYGEEYRLFALDEQGHRLARSIRLKAVPLIRDPEYVTKVGEMAGRSPGLSLRMCAGGRSYIAVDASNAVYFSELFRSDQVWLEYRNEIWENLLHYYYDHDRMDELDQLLTEAKPADMSTARRAELVEHLVIRGRVEEAYQCVLRYGMEKISPKVMVRLLSRLLKKRGREKDERLLCVCYRTFRKGKYDEEMLMYLAGCYEGLTRELRNIWKAAGDFGMDTFSLAGRLIVQMLFTGEFVGEKDDIFEDYMKGVPDERIELAYLSYESYRYFVREEITDDRVFRHLVTECRRGVQLNDVCRLALLKYYTGAGVEEREEAEGLLLHFLDALLKKNIYFNFFMEYREILPKLSAYQDKTVVEYRATPHSRVTIHYCLDSGESGDGRYEQEEMRNMFGGIFVREFILFFGDELQYYITEATDGEERITESHTVCSSDAGPGGTGDRFDLLNDMSVGQTLRDDESLLKLMERYAFLDDMADLMFGILGPAEPSGEADGE